MASKVFIRNQKLPYAFNMMPKTICFISECPQFIRNLQGRLLCSKSNSISISDSKKVRTIQISHLYSKATTQFNNNIQLDRKYNFTSVLGSFIRSLSFIPPKGRLQSCKIIRGVGHK